MTPETTNEIDSVKKAELKLARAEAWQPFALVAGVVAVIAAVVILLSGGHIAVATNTLLSILCLLPLLTLTAPLLIGVVVANFMLRRADKSAVRRLVGLEKQAASASGQAHRASRAAGEKFIGFAAAVERLSPLWDIFDTREKESENVAQPEDQNQPPTS